MHFRRKTTSIRTWRRTIRSPRTATRSASAGHRDRPRGRNEEVHRINHIHLEKTPRKSITTRRPRRRLQRGGTPLMESSRSGHESATTRLPISGAQGDARLRGVSDLQPRRGATCGRIQHLHPSKGDKPAFSGEADVRSTSRTRHEGRDQTELFSGSTRRSSTSEAPAACVASSVPIVQETALGPRARRPRRCAQGKRPRLRYFPEPDLVPVELSRSRSPNGASSFPKSPRRAARA